MSDLISIHHLTRLVHDQARILQRPETAELPPYNPVFPERNEHELTIDDERWSVSVGRSGERLFVHRDSGRSVHLRPDHPSPFAFCPRGVLHFVASVEADDQLNQLVVENWVVANFRRGRLVATAEHPGYYTFAR